MTADTKSFGPYSLIREVGELYFTAGHVGVDPITKTVDDDVTLQTTKTLDSLSQTLGSVGLTLDDVVKTTVFVTDMSDFDAINAVYVTRFVAPCPARSTVTVKELPRVATNGPVKIEIEAIASKTGKA